jgi:hypothetical protein
MGPPRLEAGEVRHQEAVDLLSSLGAGSVQVLFADPPYGIGYHSNYYKGKNPHAPITRDWNFQISEFLAESARVLCDGGALYLCCRWDVTPLWAMQIPLPLKLKTAIAWVKDNWSAGDLTGSFGNQYEQIGAAGSGRPPPAHPVSHQGPAQVARQTLVECLAVLSRAGKTGAPPSAKARGARRARHLGVVWPGRPGG